MSAGIDRAAPLRGTAERILDVAERLFAERGYEGASLRAVAARVGIQNPSVYSHFPSKAALYDAVLERALRPILDDFWARDDEIELLMRHLAAHPYVAQLLLRETAAGSSRPSPAVSGWVSATIERSRAWLEEQPGAQRLDPRALRLRVLALYHVVLGFFASRGLCAALAESDPLGEEAMQEQMRIVEAVSAALFRAPDA